MKEYMLTGWPELSTHRDRTAYRRVLHAMSQRYASVSQLAGDSGLPRREVREFIGRLQARGQLKTRHITVLQRLRQASQSLGHRMLQSSAAMMR